MSLKKLNSLISSEVLSNYLGRDWNWEEDQHCYGLIKDFYMNEYGIELAEYSATTPEKASQMALFDNYVSEGFEEVEDRYKLQNGDVLLMALRSSIPNHLALVVNADRGIILHHLHGRRSELQLLNGIMLKATTKVLRYESNKKSMVVKEINKEYSELAELEEAEEQYDDISRSYGVEDTKSV